MASPNFCRMQSAYRKGHNTETALLYIYNDIFKSMDNRRGTVLVSLDLSAAFDMVDHDKLIQRLSDCFGLTGVAVTWVQSYLSNREQFIKIRDHSSRAARMESGVPQGSVLGPFLFSTYVSPLSKIIPDTVKFHQYADDTQLYCSISTSEFASEVTRLQDCVRDVSDWFLTNCMQLNGDKSEAMLFALGAQAAKVDPKATVDIAGSAMELSADIRSLGVHMDGQLNMDRHVNSVCSSCYWYQDNIPPDNIPPDNIPPDNIPPDNIPPDNIPPDNIPPGQYPPRQYPPSTVPPPLGSGLGLGLRLGLG